MEICPKDCILSTIRIRFVGPTEPVFIDPDECIDCAACVPTVLGSDLPDADVPSEAAGCGLERTRPTIWSVCGQDSVRTALGQESA